MEKTGTVGDTLSQVAPHHCNSAIHPTHHLTLSMTHPTAETQHITSLVTKEPPLLCQQTHTTPTQTQHTAADSTTAGASGLTCPRHPITLSGSPPLTLLVASIATAPQRTDRVATAAECDGRAAHPTSSEQLTRRARIPSTDQPLGPHTRTLPRCAPTTHHCTGSHGDPVRALTLSSTSEAQVVSLCQRVCSETGFGFGVTRVLFL